MKTNHSLYRYIICGFLIIISIFIFVYVYYPFCKYSLILADCGEGPSSIVPMIEKRNNIGNVKDKYIQTLFLNKGTSFNNIPYKVGHIDLRFNWNNTISIKSRQSEYNFHVNNINIYRCDDVMRRIQNFGGYISKAGKFLPFTKTKKEREIKITNLDRELERKGKYQYLRIDFTDENDDSVSILKQLDELPYKGRQYGFKIKVKDIMLITGTQSHFDY